MLTPAQIELLIKIGIMAIVIGASAAGGWMVNGWRLGTKVAELEGVVATQKQSMATFEGVNKSCVAGVDAVKGAVKLLVDDSLARTAAAAEAMKAAEAVAKAHQAAATAALNRPLPAAGKECEALIAEAVEYAKKRKGAP